MVKSCLNCLHSEVCKFYHGEMFKHDYSDKDFMREITNIRKNLAKDCPEYIERIKPER